MKGLCSSSYVFGRLGFVPCVSFTIFSVEIEVNREKEAALMVISIFRLLNESGLYSCPGLLGVPVDSFPHFVGGYLNCWNAI